MVIKNDRCPSVRRGPSIGAGLKASSTRTALNRPLGRSRRLPPGSVSYSAAACPTLHEPGCTNSQIPSTRIMLATISRKIFCGMRCSIHFPDRVPTTTPVVAINAIGHCAAI